MKFISPKIENLIKQDYLKLTYKIKILKFNQKRYKEEKTGSSL